VTRELIVSGARETSRMAVQLPARDSDVLCPQRLALAKRLLAMNAEVFGARRHDDRIVGLRARLLKTRCLDVGRLGDSFGDDWGERLKRRGDATHWRRRVRDGFAHPGILGEPLVRGAANRAIGTGEKHWRGIKAHAICGDSGRDFPSRFGAFDHDDTHQGLLSTQRSFPTALRLLRYSGCVNPV